MSATGARQGPPGRAILPCHGAVALLLALGGVALASSGTWNGTGGNPAGPTKAGELWSDPGKWVGGTNAGTVGTMNSPDTLFMNTQGHHTLTLDDDYNISNAYHNVGAHAHAIVRTNGTSVLVLTGGGSITSDTGGGSESYYTPIRLAGGSGGSYSFLGRSMGVYGTVSGTATEGGNYDLILGGAGLGGTVGTSGAYVGNLADGDGGGTLSVTVVAGFWTLGNTNAYTGTTTVRNGRLKFSQANSFGPGDSAIVLGDGGTAAGSTLELEQANNITFTRPITVNNANPAGTTLISVRNNLGSPVIGSLVTLNRTVTIHTEGSGFPTFSGRITGPGGIIKTGPDRATLGNALNDFEGGTTVSAGTLVASVAGALGSGPVAVNGGVLRANHGVGLPAALNLPLNGGVWESGAAIDRMLGVGPGEVQLSGYSGFSAYGGSISVRLNGGAGLVWGATPGFNPTPLVLNESTANSALTFPQPLDLNGADRTVAVNANAALLSGPIGNSGPMAGLIKTGNGTLTLAGTNNFDGGLTLRAGTLVIKGPNTYGGTTTVSGAAMTVDYAEQNTGVVLIPATPLVMNGGTFSVSGSAAVGQATVQTVAGVTLAPGAAGITVLANGGRPVVLNLGAISRDTGGMVNFVLPAGTQDASNGITTSTGGAGGRLGNWATVGGTEWAARSGDNIVAYSAVGAYTDVTRLSSGEKTVASNPGGQVRIVEGTGIAGDITPAVAGTTDIGTLLHTATGATTNNPGATDVLRLGAEGCVLMVGSAGPLVIGSGGGDGRLTAGGAADAPGTILLVNQSAGNGLTVNSIIEDNGSGAVSVEKGGVGPVTLAGANTFSGGLTLSAGTLTVTTLNGLGSGRLTINGGQLNLSATNLTVSSLAGSGGTISYSGRTLTVGGDNTSTTFAGIFAGNGGLTKVGSGVLTLWTPVSSTTLSSFSGGGGLVVAAGTLRLGASDRINGGTGVGVRSGATFDLNGFNQAVGSFSLQGGSTILIGDGTLTVTASTRPFGGIDGGTGTLTLVSGHVHFSAPARVDLDVRLNAAGQGIAQVFDGVISGAVGGIGLTGNQQAAAVVRFQGTAANTFTGTVTWSASTLELGKSAGVAAIPANLAVTGGTVKWLADEQVADRSTVTLSGGKLNLNGRSDWVRELTFGAVRQVEGTWGGVGSGARNTNATYFAAGAGVLRVGVKPDPGTVLFFK